VTLRSPIAIESGASAESRPGRPALSPASAALGGELLTTAGRSGRAAVAVAAAVLHAAPDPVLFCPVVGYGHGDHGQIRELWRDPATLLGLSDGGAH